MDSVCSDGGPLRRVSPFRYLRINGYLLLPEAFRSLSRLSSALSAKASTIRSFLHDQRDLKDGFFQVHTCIALHALVFGQFFCFVFFKVCNHYTVSCYNNYLGCLDQDILIFYFLYAVFKVHARCDGCGHIKNRKVLEACFHKLFCFLMYRHLCRDRENLFSRLARSHSSLLTDVLSVIRNLNFYSNL